VRALVIGRYQPFHLGHLHVIREVAREADELIIAIAAAADSGTEKNPFNAEERGEMIGRALQEAGIGPFIVVDVPDIHDPPRWAAYVMGKVPPFDVVVAHNTETLELFEPPPSGWRRCRGRGCASSCQGMDSGRTWCPPRSPATSRPSMVPGG
jgi:nicotinamide-nucleotide adenylyltransferase